jgi:hypothetical protein
MNPYLSLGSGLDTNEAQSLGARLSAWHDAMVTHERRLRSGRTSDVCDDECPHADARALWSEAIAVFGKRAHELAFLRSRATGSARRPKDAGRPGQPLAEAADAGATTREIQQKRALQAGPIAIRAVEL